MKSGKPTKTIIAIVLIGAASAYLFHHVTSSSWSYYCSVSDFVNHEYRNADYTFRIAGRVKPGSISKDAERMSLTFLLEDAEAAVLVLYVGAVPDNFSPGKEVVVTGRMDPNGFFRAYTLITRCESKYKTKVQ
ncbi:MAG: cytochrome c maturation protein CcmE [Planctomycetota bacterium]